MKNAFRGYYPPDERELSEMWAEGILILDTNALLNLFRYSQTTRDDFIRVLRARPDALWLPHQVGWEFHRRRLDVVHQQDDAFDEIDRALNAAKETAQKALRKFERHPSLNTVELTTKIEQSLDEIGELVSAARSRHAATVVASGQNDLTLAEITELYYERVGAPLSEQVLQELYATGASRYAKKIPPGFSDYQKPEPDRYGDLVIWMQILEKAREASRPAIFVTDDSKEDWWQKSHGKTVGPRVELVAEYYEAAGARIHFYSPERFLAYAKEKGTSISQASLSEVERVSTARNTDRAAAILVQHREQLMTERESVHRRLHGIHDRAHDAERRHRAQARMAELERRLDDTQRLRHHLDLELRDALSQVGEVSVDAKSSGSEVTAYVDGLRMQHDSLERDLARQVRDLEEAARELDGIEPERVRRLTRNLVARAVELDGELEEVSRAIQELEGGSG